MHAQVKVSPFLCTTQFHLIPPTPHSTNHSSCQPARQQQICDALGVVYIEDDLRRHEPKGRSSAGGAPQPAPDRAAAAAAAAAGPPPSAANNGAGAGDGSEPMSEVDDGANAAAGGGGSSDGGSSDGGGGSSDDEAMEEQSSDGEDRDMLVECGVRQGKWERHEAELEKVRV
jgi:hypothetical protein